jgi:hypothetical protein
VGFPITFPALDLEREFRLKVTHSGLAEIIIGNISGSDEGVDARFQRTVKLGWCLIFVLGNARGFV